MIAGATLLFFMAVAWGRGWCGFACPQSVWTWLFIRIVQLTEGRASERSKTDHLPLRGTRLLRRVLKHLPWILLATFTAITVSGYFVPDGDSTFTLIGPGTIHLSDSNSAWLPYRICGSNMDERNAKLEFIFTGNGISTSKETSFLSKQI